MKNFLIWCGAITFLLSPFVYINGQENDWKFTEVMANASDENTGEFLELIYEGESEVMLSGWTLQDNKEEDNLLDYTGEYDVGESCLMVVKGDILLIVDADYDGEYNLYLASEEVDLSKVVMITVEDGEIGNGLGNSGDELVLKNSDGVVVTEFVWSSDAGDGKSWELIGNEWRKSDLVEGHSMGKLRLETDIDDEDDDGEEEDDVNDEDDKTVVATWERFWQGGDDPVLINELVINPIGDEKAGEWIELMSYWDEEIDLSGWWLCDNKCDENSKEGGYKIDDLVLGANGYVVVERANSGIALNNDKDSVFLYDPKHDLVAGLVYELSAKEGDSYAWDEKQWKITNTITKGSVNIFTNNEDNSKTENDEEGEEDETNINSEDEEKKEEEKEYKELQSIESVKNEKEGINVEFEGVVSATWGLLETKYIWVQDAEGGVSVKIEEDPSFAIGDKVWIKGKRKNLTYREIVEAEDWKKMGNGELKIWEIKSGEVGQHEDQLIKIMGNVVSTSGDDFVLNDGSGDLRVYIKENTGIIKPEMKKGDSFEIVGVVNEIKSGFRVLPRVQDDVGKSDAKILLPSVGVNWCF